MNYRNEVKQVEQEARWTFFRFLPLIVIICGILFAVGFGLRSMGIFGSIVVERKVFENSYQRSESIRSQIATDEAVLEEITKKLSNPNLDDDTRFNLEAQASAARLRINTARNKQ